MGATTLMSDKVSIFAPASIGNLSVGFDVLGLAVKPIDGFLLGDIVSVESSPHDELVVIGDFANKLPTKKEENIVWQCLKLFNEKLTTLKHAPITVKLTLNKKMPVGSGLGSSACSVVAALHALNAFYEKRLQQSIFTHKNLLKMMGQMEANISGSLHYDNVAPCFLGGLQLMIKDDSIISRNLPDFSDCYYVMAYPGINVSTKAARDVLPKHYSRADLIHYGQHLASFVDACHRGDKQQAFAMLIDVVAEPYRKQLLPNYQQSKDYLLAQGALAVGISGSGPTLFCITDNKIQAAQFALWLKDNYLQTEKLQTDKLQTDKLQTDKLQVQADIHEGFVHVCQAAQQGSIVLHEDK